MFRFLTLYPDDQHRGVAAEQYAVGERRADESCKSVAFAIRHDNQVGIFGFDVIKEQVEVVFVSECLFFEF